MIGAQLGGHQAQPLALEAADDLPDQTRARRRRASDHQGAVHERRTASSRPGAGRSARRRRRASRQQRRGRRRPRRASRSPPTAPSAVTSRRAWLHARPPTESATTTVEPERAAPLRPPPRPAWRGGESGAQATTVLTPASSAAAPAWPTGRARRACRPRPPRRPRPHAAESPSARARARASVPATLWAPSTTHERPAAHHLHPARHPHRGEARRHHLLVERRARRRPRPRPGRTAALRPWWGPCRGKRTLAVGGAGRAQVDQPAAHGQAVGRAVELLAPHPDLAGPAASATARMTATSVGVGLPHHHRGCPALMMPALSAGDALQRRAEHLGVVVAHVGDDGHLRRRPRWWSPSVPPRPTSTTATSTASSANQRRAAAGQQLEAGRPLGEQRLERARAASTSVKDSSSMGSPLRESRSLTRDKLGLV